MYHYALILLYFNVASCANYQRYDTTGYPSYSTGANPFMQDTYRNMDLPGIQTGSRYPNYNPGYSTSGYNTYNTARNVYTPGYTTPGYGGVYNRGYDQGSYNSYEMPFARNSRDYCVNRSPQLGIWVDDLMGMWYGVEEVQHLGGDFRVKYDRTCIVLHIAEPMERPSTENQVYHVQHINAKFRNEYRHLRLLWDEAGQTIEYSLYFRNDSAGYWQVYNDQNGSLPSQGTYRQFSGTVQVLKAVKGHLVLNFCQEAKNNRPAQLFTVLFSREPGNMAMWEIESVHNLLQMKRLSTASRRMVCGNNSADKPLQSFALSIVFIALTYLSVS